MQSRVGGELTTTAFPSDNALFHAKMLEQFVDVRCSINDLSAQFPRRATIARPRERDQLDALLLACAAQLGADGVRARGTMDVDEGEAILCPRDKVVSLAPVGVGQNLCCHRVCAVR